MARNDLVAKIAADVAEKNRLSATRMAAE
jgi:hypothetical protein